MYPYPGSSKLESLHTLIEFFSFGAKPKEEEQATYDNILDIYDKIRNATKSMHNRFKNELRDSKNAVLRVHPSHVMFGKVLKETDKKVNDLMTAVKRIDTVDEIGEFSVTVRETAEDFLQSLLKVSESIDSTRNREYLGNVVVNQATAGKIIDTLCNDIVKIVDKQESIIKATQNSLSRIEKTGNYNRNAGKLFESHGRFVKIFFICFDHYLKKYIAQLSERYKQ
jgi:hypothetical protein